MKVTVIGGANRDILGSSEKSFTLRDSNIGKVGISFGGVGHNIAYNCRLLGLQTDLITAVGNDHDGRQILEHLDKIDVGHENVLVSGDTPTDKYLAITDEKGDMIAAINDMQCVRQITPKYLMSLSGLSASLIAVDANLNADTLSMVSGIKNRLTFFEPVSAAKADKAKDFIGGFDIIKPNLMEAEVLSGIKINKEEDIVKAGKYFVRQGVRATFITAGSNGVYAFFGTSVYHKKAPKLEVVNSTGAGDAFSAGVIYSILNGYKLTDTVAFAMKCSELALSCDQAVNEGLSAELVNIFLEGTKK